MDLYNWPEIAWNADVICDVMKDYIILQVNAFYIHWIMLRKITSEHITLLLRHIIVCVLYNFVLGNLINLYKGLTCSLFVFYIHTLIWQETHTQTEARAL